jgi:LmbE family N-acetylglucosaminyl deacetylase
MFESLRNKRILVVVAHPDDEILGLGATMYRLIRDYGCIVRAIILGEGITSRSDIREIDKWKEQLKIHKGNIETACKYIGYESVGVYSFPDNRFDSVALLEIIKVVEAEKGVFNPDVIFTHHGGDVNIDHQRTFEAVITASRPMSHEKTSTIITFETMSGTEWRATSDPRHFLPNLISEISEEALHAKCMAMESYEFEKRPYPHPRSCKALKVRAQMWGVANGVEMAEAFQVIRSIEKYENRKS